MLTVKDIADYFLSKCDEEAGDTISNLKIQKLVYYAQGFYLAIKGKPLFKESIESWIHGPVVPKLYDEFKNYGSSSISIPKDVDFDKYPKDVKEILNEVYDVYGQFSAWKLRELIHNESPCKNTPEGKGSVISHEKLKKYFSAQIEEAHI